MGGRQSGGTRPDLIRVEVDARTALERFGRAAEASKNHLTPNRQLATQLTAWTFRNFQSGGSMQTPSWRPLKESTLKAKRKRGYSSQPLIRTGHLRQSFRPFYDNNQAGTGSEVPYSQYHETGTDTLPQRAMLPPESVALDYAVKIYERWAAGLARTAS
jgi:phage gpG-like protein